MSNDILSGDFNKDLKNLIDKETKTSNIQQYLGKKLKVMTGNNKNNVIYQFLDKRGYTYQSKLRNLQQNETFKKIISKESSAIQQNQQTFLNQQNYDTHDASSATYLFKYINNLDSAKLKNFHKSGRIDSNDPNIIKQIGNPQSGYGHGDESNRELQNRYMRNGDFASARRASLTSRISIEESKQKSIDKTRVINDGRKLGTRQVDKFNSMLSKNNTNIFKLKSDLSLQNDGLRWDIARIKRANSVGNLYSTSTNFKEKQGF